MKTIFHALARQEQSGEALINAARERRAELRAAAKANGFASEMAALEAPPAPTPPGIPMVRIRALKPYKVEHRTRPGDAVEIYSGGVNAVNDLPRACLASLAARVVVVEPNAEMVGVPLPIGAATEGD